MKIKNISGIVIVSVFLISCGSGLPEKAPNLASRIELSAGDVTMEISGRKKPAGTGSMIASGTRLTVGVSGRCLIRLSEGTAIFLKGGTTVIITDEGVDLDEGEMWTEIPDKEDELFVCRAGRAKISAEKAGIDIENKNGKVNVFVIRGLAVVESEKGRTEVSNGEKASVTGESAPETSSIDFWEDWTGGMADHSIKPSAGGKGAGRIYAIDRSKYNSPPQELQIKEQQVRVFIKDGIARTEVTQSFFNPWGNPVEGWYWFTLPEGAAVTRFAIEVEGQMVDGEIVERKLAAKAYEEAVQRAFDPALLEWINGRTYRARIFPVPAAGERKIVLAYSEFLPMLEGVTRYLYPMGEGESVRIQEFSLMVDLGDEGKNLKVTSIQDARIEDGGKKVTMKRSGFTPHGDFLLEIKDEKKKEPVRIVRYKSYKEEADYLMLRYSPEEDWDAVPLPEGVVVIIVDTSAGGDESDRKLKNDAAHAILRALSGSDKFAVVNVDIVPKLVYPLKEGLSDADEKNIPAAMEKLSEVSTGGATDLGDVFNFSLKLVHGAAQPAIIYIGDGNPTVGEIKNDELVERLKRSISGSKARFFTMALGSANYPLLERLASTGGGYLLRVDLQEQIVQEAINFVGALKTPTITDLKIDMGAGIDQMFSSGTGKVSRGQEVFIFGRTHHPLPEKIKVTGMLGGKNFERIYETKEKIGTEYAYTAPLWAMQYLKFLLGSGSDENRGQIISLGLEYSLMTPFTSFLVLESNQAYEQQGIKRRPRHPVWGFISEQTDESVVAENSFSIPFLWGCAKSDQRKIAEKPATEQAAGLKTQEVRPPASPTEAKMVPAAAVKAEESAGIGRYAGDESQYEAKAMSAGDKAVRYKKALSETQNNSILKFIETKPAGSAPSMPKMGIPLKDAFEDGQTLAGGGGFLSGAFGNGGIATAEKADLETGKGVLIAESQEKTEPPVAIDICSDASKRSLSLRRDIWMRKLSANPFITYGIDLFHEAERECELDGWKAEKTLLDLILLRVKTAGDINYLLDSFKNRQKIQTYLRKELLKRIFSHSIKLPTGINWNAVDAVLLSIADPEKRLSELKKILSMRPNDPEALRRLLYALLDLNQKDEALIIANKIRNLGFHSPQILEILGDLLAEKGDTVAAKKIYSEIVEHNPTDSDARRLLGDIFLRYGWYEDAYRQYSTLLLLSGTDPADMIRQALAASGAGRTDEGLRTLNRIIEMSLEPGKIAVRDWAKLWSAVKISRLMLSEKKDGEKLKALERTLKRTEVFGSPATLYILTWEDTSAKLVLKFKQGHDEFTATDIVDASPVCLTGSFINASQTGTGQNAIKPVPVVEWGNSGLKRSVKYEIVTIVWDGKQFTSDIMKSALDQVKPVVAK